jgi:hypothetical protein
VNLSLSNSCPCGRDLNWTAKGLIPSRSIPRNLKIKICRTIILPVVLYGYWLLTLKEKCRLSVFENQVLRIYGPKRDNVIGEWRKLRVHNEMDEINDLFSC